MGTLEVTVIYVKAATRGCISVNLTGTGKSQPINNTTRTVHTKLLLDIKVHSCLRSNSFGVILTDEVHFASEIKHNFKFKYRQNKPLRFKVRFEINRNFKHHLTRWNTHY